MEDDIAAAVRAYNEIVQATSPPLNDLQQFLLFERLLGLYPPEGIAIHEWGLRRGDFPAAESLPKSTKLKRMEISFRQIIVERGSRRSLRKLIRLALTILSKEEVETVYQSGRRCALCYDHAPSKPFREIWP